MKKHILALRSRARDAAIRLLYDRGFVFVDYPPNPKARYGHTHPPLEALWSLFDAERTSIKRELDGFVEQREGLARIPYEKSGDPAFPEWDNGTLDGVDALALYGYLAQRNPRRYVEVGSGNSTRFAYRSIQDHQLDTRIISIDPEPRAPINALCDEVHRSPLEDCALDPFLEAAAGDIVVLDGSHRCFQNSDVTVFFLEVLPRLASGVLVYIDDIYLPYDYPVEWEKRYYSEQYVLAAILQADAGRRYRVVLPHVFIDRDDDLRAHQQAVLDRIGVQIRSGNGIWLEIR